MAVFATIFVSAFVHEYLLALTLKFASPVLMVEFAGLGGMILETTDAANEIVLFPTVLFYLMRPLGKRRISNLFVLFCLCLGGANLVFYYQAELAARLYCPEEVNIASRMYGIIQ